MGWLLRVQGLGFRFRNAFKGFRETGRIQTDIIFCRQDFDKFPNVEA